MNCQKLQKALFFPLINSLEGPSANYYQYLITCSITLPPLHLSNTINPALGLFPENSFSWGWIEWEGGRKEINSPPREKEKSGRGGGLEQGRIKQPNCVVQLYTASLSHLRTMLPESSSGPLPAKWPNHATQSLFDSKSLYSCSYRWDGIVIVHANTAWLKGQRVIITQLPG